jgi:hypothetical protein
LGLLHAERDRDRLRVRPLSTVSKLSTSEGAADLIAGQVLEYVERQQLVKACSPRRRRREGRARLRLIDRDRTVNFFSVPSDTKCPYEQPMVECQKPTNVWQPRLSLQHARER